MLNNELQKNLKAFNKFREEYEQENFGRTALLHDGEMIAIYNDKFDAYTTGCDRYGLGYFLIETFGAKPKSLGFFTTNLHISNHYPGVTRVAISVRQTFGKTEPAEYCLYRFLNFLFEPVPDSGCPRGRQA